MPEEKQRRRRGMAEDDLNRQFPSLSHLAGPTSTATKRAWVAVFNARPDAMHSLLADFIKQVHAQPGRIGQRPMPKEEVVDFHGLLYGEENDMPLVEVLPKLIQGSERAFTERLASSGAMSRTQFRRMMRGQHDPDVNELRMIAAALKKPPTFFIEYRKAMAVAAFLNLLDERPGIATMLYRQYLEVRVGGT